jgi:hypothetical protein
LSGSFSIGRTAAKAVVPEELKMDIENEIEVPESVLLQATSGSKYGHVPGLDDDELADPDELERQVYEAEFAPILALPVQKGYRGIRPDTDESGGVDWGAFGTVDFERLHPFDKTASQVRRLKWRLTHVLIMLSIVKDRMPGNSKYLVLKYLRMGILCMDDIADEDMRFAAGWYMEARRLREEIRSLMEARQRRRLAEREV